MTMSLSQDCLALSSLQSCLRASELCCLDTTSKGTSLDISDAWVPAAQQAGVLLTTTGKKSIKEVLGAVQKSDDILRPRDALMPAPKSAKDLAKATDQMRRMKTKHLQAGGKIAHSFVASFNFPPEDVAAYAANPRLSTVTSLPVPMIINDNVVEMTLTWREGSMLLSLENAEGSAGQPLGINLASVSSPLTMHNLYRIWEARREYQGAGLCCLLQKPAAFAKNMEEGFMCAGFVQDLCTLPWGPSVSDALQLDKPGWSARDRVLEFCSS